MDDSIGRHTLPINLDASANELSQNHPSHSPQPVIPTEESYFSEAPAHRKSIGLRDLGVILNNKRRATRHVPIRGAGTAWIDQDDSGTYDPKKDRATPTPPLTRSRRRRRARTYGEDDGSVTPSPRTRRSRSQVGYRSSIVFYFTSEKALNYLRSITPGPFDRQSATLDGDLSDITTEPGERYGFGPALRERRIRRLRKARETVERQDGLTIDELTIGHPQRRGCKVCFEAGDDGCSLIEHGQDYPCTACDDASIDCEYIIPPELKKSCERCKRKRISCSYRLDGGKDVESCDACAEAETKCLAAPLKGSLRKQDDDSIAEVAAPRQYTACNQCRNNSLRCTLKRDQPGPCTNCKNKGENCQFVLIPHSIKILSDSPPPTKPKRAQRTGKAEQKPARKVAPQVHDPEVDHTPGRHEGHLESTLLAEAYYHGYGKRRLATLLNERARYQAHTTKKQEKLEAQARKRSTFAAPAYTPEFTPPLGSSGGIKHIRIKTAFSHPIKFNYIPDPKGTSPCDWCSSPLFGISGHGEIEVEVVPFPEVNGHGYEELPGGHADMGFSRSAMCVACTFERVNIMGCEKHILQPIQVDPRVSDIDELKKSVQALTDGDEAGGQLIKSTKWCAICPTAASFKCCARQPEDDLSHDFVVEGRGCGLYLCANCQDFMAKISNSRFWNSSSEILDRIYHCASTDPFNWDAGIRADASFLTSTGELMVRIQKGMGEDPIDADKDDGGQSSEGEAGDEEIWMILERVGKGKGKWNEKQKPVAVVHQPGQGMPIPTMQQSRQIQQSAPTKLKHNQGGVMRRMGPKQPARGWVGSKRQQYIEPRPSLESGEREREAQLREMGLGAEWSGKEGKVAERGGHESSGVGKGSRPGLKGKCKGNGKAAVSEVVAIDDSEDD